MKTAIVTDTNSSMSVDEGRCRGIFVLPMPVIIDDTTYLEGENITYSEVFRAMAENRKVSTSQPSPGEVHDLWKKVLSQGYDEIVYIPMSSGLSSSYHTAVRLAEDFDGKVKVVDNHRISLTLYESILDAKEMADNGVEAETIRKNLEEKAMDTTIYITVDSIEHLKKSGRITAAGAALAMFFKIRPVLTIQGERLDAYAKVRGILAAERRMIEATRRDLMDRFGDRPKNKVLVGAAGTLISKTDIEKWSNKIKEAFPGYPFLYHPLSCSIACHTGPNAIGTGFVCVERENW